MNSICAVGPQSKPTSAQDQATSKNLASETIK